MLSIWTRIPNGSPDAWAWGMVAGKPFTGIPDQAKADALVRVLVGKYPHAEFRASEHKPED